MTTTTSKHACVWTAIVMLLCAASLAHAQAPDSRFSAEVGIGFDNGISGNINSSGIGTINNQVVVIMKNSYEDVYGTGLNLRFGGGYMLNEDTEVNATFTFQSLDADFVVPMGDIGVSNLYAQYTDYQTLLLDFGLRRYMSLRSAIRLYGEGTIGLGFVDKTDVMLVAPGANLVGQANDFYDQTAAFTVGVNAGALFQANDRMGVFVQMGLHFVSGMTEIDDLVGTGLDNINDKSSRWTLPFVTGVRFRF
jgi:opacity protein-like surface antigen